MRCQILLCRVIIAFSVLGAGVGGFCADEENAPQVTSLEMDLQSAQAALEQSELEANERVAASEARAEALAVIVAALESQSQLAQSDLEEMACALEAARLRSAELFAAQAALVVRGEAAIDSMEQSALSSALDEIDMLEREYADLDASASKRQYELMMRIDALEQSTVTGEFELAEVCEQLKIERSLRIAAEAQGEKRDSVMLEANCVLSEAVEKMALHFDAIRTQMGGAPELRIADTQGTSADLAPLIGKLEAATESATVEVKALRQLLAEEQEHHAATKSKAFADLAQLRQHVELLTDEMATLKTLQAERESELKAEMEQKLQESQAKADARESELKTQHEAHIVAVREAMSAEREAGEAALRKEISSLAEKIRDLESVFALPTSEDAAPLRQDGVGNSEVNERVDALYQSIIDTARKDKGLAIVQFESLPKDSVKPVELLTTVANLYREVRAYDTAYSIYTEILTRDPGNLYAERKLVMTLFDMGRYDEALERLAGPQQGATEDAADTDASVLHKK